MMPMLLKLAFVVIAFVTLWGVWGALITANQCERDDRAGAE